MPLRAAYAPYRLTVGALPEEVARVAATQVAGPLVVSTADPLPAALLTTALAELPVGRAASEAEACRAADGTPSGLGGPARACLTSERHRARVAEAARAALLAGFAGVSLDRPDASLAQGLLGAGFCPDCQREFGRRLSREYGDQFQPLDYLKLAREAVASAPGALGFSALPFGRDFWRFRHESLERAVASHARAANDAARAAGRPFSVSAWFEAVGPAQLAAARHLDAAVFPTGDAATQGLGLFALLRAAMGRRPVAVTAPSGTPPAQLLRLASLGAPFGVGLAGLEGGPEVGLQLARVRRVVRQVAEAGRAPGAAEPLAECALLYSAEADLWSGGRHRRAVELAAEALAAHHVQAPVVLRLSDAPPSAVIVLADAAGLGGHEARALSRRLENGGGVLTFGAPSEVDGAGHGPGSFLPAGKPGGVKAGGGTVAELPALVSPRGDEPRLDDGLLEKALAALLGKGRRAVGVTGRAKLAVRVWRQGESLDVHLATLGPERSQGNTLFLGMHLVGAARKARFQPADGGEVSIRLNPSGYSVSTILPSFAGYAVLSVEK
ncbi:MAG: hypothetical protein IPQ24_20575 [Anaeromyxobacter sp.]|nr:hypothetical protein [Anaeromyxobacter sp.]